MIYFGYGLCLEQNTTRSQETRQNTTINTTKHHKKHDKTPQDTRQNTTKHHKKHDKTRKETQQICMSVRNPILALSVIVFSHQKNVTPSHNNFALLLRFSCIINSDNGFPFIQFLFIATFFLYNY